MLKPNETNSDDSMPEHWRDLTREERSALLRVARGRLFWEQAKDKIKESSKMISWAAIIITAVTAFQEQFYEFLAWFSELLQKISEEVAERSRGK